MDDNSEYFSVEALLDPPRRVEWLEANPTAILQIVSHTLADQMATMRSCAAIVYRLGKATSITDSIEGLSDFDADDYSKMLWEQSENIRHLVNFIMDYESQLRDKSQGKNE